MKKRITAFALTLVLMIGTFSTGVMAATQSEVDGEAKATAEYIASQTPTSLIDIEKYQEVMMLIESDVNKDAYVAAFLASVRANNLSPDGKLLLSGTENPKAYAAVLLVLAKAGIDATNFDGFNLVANFETCMKSYSDAAAFKTAVNSAYSLQPIMFAVQGYSSKLANPAPLMEMVKDAIISYYVVDGTYGYILDLYGGTYFSADDCGSMLLALKFFYNTDSDVKTKVDASIAYIKDQLTVNNIIESWGDPSAESTAHALAVLRTYGDPLADSVYTGLLTLKDEELSGAYLTPYDQVYASSEAYKGLRTYGKMMSSSLTMWDVTAASPIIISPITISPKTADNSVIYFFGILAIASAATIIVFTRKKILQ